MAHGGADRWPSTAAESSLHFHGGYGFMLEYEVQRYVRRAKAARIALGDPRHELQTIAGVPLGRDRTGLRSHARRVGRGHSRTEVRTFLADNLTDEMIEEAHRTGTMHDEGLHRAIASRGYLAAGWPVEVGGSGRSAIETTVLMQELYGAGAPVDSMGIVSMVAATLVLLGNEAQRTEIVPRMLSGDALACLGYSEPDAGSDVAAVQTRAVQDGRRVAHQRTEDVHDDGAQGDYVFLLSARAPRSQSTKGSRCSSSDDTSRYRDHPCAHAWRRAHEHHVTRMCACPMPCRVARSTRVGR